MSRSIGARTALVVRIPSTPRRLSSMWITPVCSSPRVTGVSVMEQIGHFPGTGECTEGCIEQV
jgi:hypothetical protein